MRGHKLGELLSSRALLGEETLKRALAIARNTRTRLGDVLVGEGMIGYKTLYETLAEHFGLTFVDLLKSPPDITLLSEAHIDDYLRMRAMPYRRMGHNIVIACAEYNDDVIRWANTRYGPDISFALTSPIDIQKSVQQLFAQNLTHQSVMKLFETSPVSSALHKITLGKTLCVAVIALFAAFAATLSLWEAFIGALGICYILYSATMLFKLTIYAAGMNRCHPHKHDPLHIPDEELPHYTVLIPMYKETESMPHLLSAMHAMDYPASKLDIKLVLEEDDDDTLDAAYALKPRYQFDIIRVPPSQPRTKPKACNYALRFAKGEYVTVYDADDRPDPQQLKKAVSAFRSLPDDVICLQARLNYYNYKDNLLTRLFSLEYAMLFHVLLYGMSRLHMPLLLGGTSNHIDLGKLRELGEWDPFNVTEDADLGTRLAAAGYKTAMLDSNTMEEAPNSFHAWFRQRARWIKGYMQTWLVHMRRPLHLARGLKPHGFIGFQFFVALSSFSYLTAPITWVFSFICITDPGLLPRWIYALGMANLGIYLGLHIITALHVSLMYRQQRVQMMLAAFCYPFYLILHSLASYLALWELFTRPYSWNKTSHGRAKTFSDFQLTSPAPAG